VEEEEVQREMKWKRLNYNAKGVFLPKSVTALHFTFVTSSNYQSRFLSNNTVTWLLK